MRMGILLRGSIQLSLECLVGMLFSFSYIKMGIKSILKDLIRGKLTYKHLK